MKKLMIAAAIVCAAVVSQAATASWSTGMTYKPVDADGTKGTALPGDLAAGATMYAFVIDGTQYADYAKLTYAEAAAQIWNDFGTGSAIDASALATKAGTDTAGNARSATLSGFGSAVISESVANASGDAFRAILITYSDATLGDFYIANIDKTTVGGEGTYAGVSSVSGTTWAGTSGGAIGSWTAVAVPEPTSGLLLLLGVAGMALRRRRA